LGIGKTPAFRDRAYVVFEDLELASFGNRVPNFEFEVFAVATQTHVTAKLGGFGAGTGLHDVVVDPQTGLVWMTDEDGDAVRIFEPNSWVQIRKITGILDAFEIDYQPSYTFVETNPASPDAGQPVLIPARMWIGGRDPDILDGKVYAIDTQTYAVTTIVDPFGGSAVAWPGAIIVDTRGFDLEEPNFSVMKVVVGSITGLSSNWVNISTVDFSVGAQFGHAGIGHVANWVVGGTKVWVIDRDGFVARVGANFIVDKSVEAVDGFGTESNKITYDEDEDKIWIIAVKTSDTTQRLVKLDSELNILFTVNLGSATEYRDVKWHKGLGDVWLMFGKQGGAEGTSLMHKLDKTDGSFAETIPVDNANLIRVESFVMYPQSSIVVAAIDDPSGGFAFRIPVIPKNVDDPPTVATVVSDICTKAGLLVGDIDVTALTSENVEGYAITRLASARKAIEPLQQVFFFDASEVDFKIKFVKRGGSVVATITRDEMGAHRDGTETPELIRAERTGDQELMNTLDVVYQQKVTYDLLVQHARRLIGDSTQRTRLELPIVITDTKAKAVADVLMHNAWQEREKLHLTVTRKFALLTPGDLISIEDETAGQFTTVRIINVDYQMPNILRLQVSQEDISIYSFALVAATPTVLPDALRSIVPTVLCILDIPMLRDADNDAGFYVAVGGFLANWRGAEILRSFTTTSSYEFMLFQPTEAAIGAATTVLASPPGDRWNIFDDVSTVTISLTSGFLSSALNDLALLNNENAALLGSEVIQFRDVVDNGDNTFTLTRFLRGRRGTNNSITSHAVGDKFVALNFAAIERIKEDFGAIGLKRRIKALSLGQTLDQVPPVVVIPAGVALEPYSPAELAATRNGGLDIIITWKRRTRFGGQWRDRVDVTLGEIFEKYEVDIFDGASVVRTFTGITVETVTYTAAQQIADFGSEQSSVVVEVFQISETVFRGFKIRQTV